MSEITLIDARSTSLTVTWPETKGATQYRLEYRTADEEGFTVLSEGLKSTQARKKNLNSDQAYFFKVTPLPNGEPVSHSEAFRTISTEADTNSMTAPKVSQPIYNQSLVISWEKSESADSYELQMRENVGGAPWTTIAPKLSSLEVKKKNLTSTAGYQFRVRPSNVEGAAFSSPSDPVVAQAIAPGIKRWFNSLDNGTLLRKQNKVSLVDALGGKEFVLLYASAHWCGPCRQFTPRLAQWYQSPRVQDFAEVVFLSADHDESGFRSYYGSQPWLAVDYEDDARENLMGAIRVTGIPRLVVISGRTGKIIEDNAVGKPLDIGQWRKHANHQL